MLCRFEWVLDEEVGLGCGGGLEVGRRGSQSGSGVQLPLLLKIFKRTFKSEIAWFQCTNKETIKLRENSFNVCVKGNNRI